MYDRNPEFFRLNRQYRVTWKRTISYEANIWAPSAEDALEYGKRDSHGEWERIVDVSDPFDVEVEDQDV